MALDPNLYTLDLIRRAEDHSVCDWVESASRTRPKTLYTRARARRSVDYATVLYRTLFGPSAPLASVSAPMAQAKSKTIQLYDPSEEVDLKKQGMTFASEWRFVYTPGGITLAWKRDHILGGSGAGKNSYTCYALRNPDPSIPVAVYKSLNGRDRREISYDILVGNKFQEGRGKQEGLLQFEDHNIRRLDLTDLRGLEYLLVMSLCSILDADYDDTYKTPTENIYLSFTPAAARRATVKDKRRGSVVQSASLNEVAIEEWGQESDYVKHCLWLLRDDGGEGTGEDQGQNMMFIVLRAEGERHVAKAIQVAAEVKRGFYKLPRRQKGTSEEELHQYIKDKAELVQAQPAPVNGDAPGGRPTIRLNDPPEERDESRNPFSRLVKGKSKETEKGYQPPEVVSIFLSKEAMPELEPAPQTSHRLSMNISTRAGPNPKSQLRPTNSMIVTSGAKPAPPQVGKAPTPLGRPAPPVGAAWNGEKVPLGFVPSGHPAPTGLAERPNRRMSGGKPPPPLPSNRVTASSPSKEQGRMSRFLARAKQVRDQPPPGSRS